MSLPLPLLEQIRQLVEELPPATIGPLVQMIAGSPAGQWATTKSRAQNIASHPHYRERVGQLIDHWQAVGAQVEPNQLAIALETAAYCAEASRQSQRLELVWTGPASNMPLRRTDQALQQLIADARHELLVVTFAVYHIPKIREALVQAVQRGVRLKIIIESPKESAGKVTYDGLRALGAQVAERAQVYRWPLEKRATDPSGKHGSLHVKCAVADGHTLLLSSANLTEYALTLNMEMGLLIQGGVLPRQVAQHFQRLIEAGILVRNESD